MNTELNQDPLSSIWQIVITPTEFGDGIPAEASDSLKSLINTPIMRRAKAQKVSECEICIIIQFHSDNEEAIISAAAFISGFLY